jgi:hypothetical protein
VPGLTPGWAKVKVIHDALRERGPERCNFGVSLDSAPRSVVEGDWPWRDWRDADRKLYLVYGCLLGIDWGLIGGYDRSDRNTTSWQLFVYWGLWGF